MIELRNHNLVFAFPEVHPDAKIKIAFQRTLRIPDDNQVYPLPPGLGEFPMHHVDDFNEKVPPDWIEHGGVMLPMFQSEALWIYFEDNFIIKRDASYPFAIKIAAGKVNAVTGQPWTNEIQKDPQDYTVSPSQKWLDGYCIKKNIIRQFVAMPLGAGYTAEEQMTHQAEYGGIQIIVYPMKREIFEKRYPKIKKRQVVEYKLEMQPAFMIRTPVAMGLAAGGRMRQKIYKDPYDFSDWDHKHKSRCFVHIANSFVWHRITGNAPPTKPPTAKEYNDAGLPWFDYYDENNIALKGSEQLGQLKSIATIDQEKGCDSLPENESVIPKWVKRLSSGFKRKQVREGIF
jgi:hypothetical protein